MQFLNLHVLAPVRAKCSGIWRRVVWQICADVTIEPGGQDYLYW
jgi:hypothetical protein